MFFAFAVQKVDNRNFYHCIASGLLFHCRTCSAYKHLSCKGGVIYAHVKLEKLVLCSTRYSFACKVYAVSHVKKLVYAGYLYYVCLVVYKICVSFYGCSNFLKFVSILNFYIYHAAVYASTCGDSH